MNTFDFQPNDSFKHNINKQNPDNASNEQHLKTEGTSNLSPLNADTGHNMENTSEYQKIYIRELEERLKELVHQNQEQKYLIEDKDREIELLERQIELSEEEIELLGEHIEKFIHSTTTFQKLTTQVQKDLKGAGLHYQFPANKLSCTEEFFAIYDLSPDYPLNLESIKSLHPIHIQNQIENEINITISTGQSRQLEFNLFTVRKNNKWLKVIIQPHLQNDIITDLYCTIQDITCQQKIKEKLSKLSLVASHTDNAVIITDKNSKIEWVNDGFTKITGYTLPEAIGKNPRFLQGPDTDPTTIAKIKEYIQKGQSFCEEILNYHKNGKPYWLKLYITPIYNEQGSITNFIAIESDITDKKASEEALRRSEATVRAIIENNQEPIYLINNYYQLVTFNQSFVEKTKSIFGTQANVGDNLIELIAQSLPDYALELKASLDKALNGEACIVNKEITTEDNEIHLQLSFNPIYKNGEIKGVSAFARDITEQVFYERKLNEKLNLQNLLSSISTKFVSIQNFEVLKKTILESLETVAQFCHADRAHLFLTDKDGSVLIHEQSILLKQAPELNPALRTVPLNENSWWGIKMLNLETIYIPNRKAIEQSGFANQEFTFYNDIKSAIVLPIVAHGKLKGMLCFDTLTKEKEWDANQAVLMKILGDIIGSALERKKAEEKIKKSEQLHKTLTTNLPNGHICLLNKDLDIIFTEGSELNKIGLHPETLIGKKVSHFAEPEMVRIMERFFIKTFNGESHTFDAIFKDEIYNVHTVPLQEEDGSIQHILVFYQNTTKQKIAEEQIISALRQKDVLLKEIYHRVKNNLAMVESLLFLQRNTVDEPHYKEMFEDCEKRIHSMALVHKSLYQSENLDSINIKDYIYQLIQHITHSIDYKCKINLHLDIDPVNINFNKAIPLGLITNELVTNSFKYAFQEMENGELFISLKETDRGYHFMVQDNGIGFSKDFQKQKSTLGLSLVSMLTNDLRGKLEIDSQKGVTTKIVFEK
jgi:PAS domain S-box-containing protein